MSFIAPCVTYLKCKQDALVPYSSDRNKVSFLECKPEKGGCGLIWRDTTGCSEERQYTEPYFAAHGYDKNREHRVRKAHLFLAILEQFSKRGRLLEVGPALGYNLEAGRERGWKVEGIDVSSYAADFCREMGISVDIGRLGENTKQDTQYDALLLKHVLEHYPDPFRALSDAHRLIKPGGFIQIFVPNADYMGARMKRSKHKFYRYEKNGIEHYVYFTKHTLRRTFEATGFEVVQENYPLTVKDANDHKSVLERLVRRMLSTIHFDREILAIARKRE